MGVSMTKMFASKLKVERASIERQLESSLRLLALNVERAREALAKGDSLDDNLIVNASGLSTLIGRWNMALEYEPYTKEETS